MAEAKPKAEWAQLKHYVVATACGGAKRGHRFTHDVSEITCRFCKLALQQQAEAARKGRAEPLGAGRRPR